MNCENRKAAMEALPIRKPNATGRVLVNNEAMSSALRWWLESAQYRALLERTRDGLLALNTHTGAQSEPAPDDGERLQREVDGVIARWKAQHPEMRR
ncbi:hypothetical protein [Nocardia sp. NPDC002869]|uniref:hypothetical protein n=1 Tax=Nocardia sp. NPDC002869 TaxID=3161032 RepID=UPI00398CE0C5